MISPAATAGSTAGTAGVVAGAGVAGTADGASSARAGVATASTRIGRARRTRLLLGPDRVGGALDERLELLEIRRLEPAGEVRHARIHERAVEQELVELRDDLGLD